MIDDLVVGVLAAALLYALIGTAGFTLAVGWAGAEPRRGVAVGLVGLGATGGLTFGAFLISPTLGSITAGALVVAAAGVIVLACRRSPSSRRALRSVAPALALLVGILLTALALYSLWGIHEEPFEYARSRFSHPLPVDNQIPHLVAQRLAAGADPRTAVPGWHSSDRPPLQTGLILMVEQVTRALGIDAATSALAAGVAAQLAWIPAIAILLRSLGVSRQGVLAGVLVTSATGTVLVNTLYTWPKLLSAAFVLAAASVCLDLRRTPAARSLVPMALAAVLCAMGLVTHGGAVFALPAILLLLLVRRRHVSRRAWGVAALAGAIAYAPWILYQRLYDPPGDRLLDWHLAGMMYPTESDFLAHVSDAYAAVGWDGALENKWANLAYPFTEWPWGGVSLSGVDLSERRAVEFFSLSGAIGLGYVPVLILLAVTLRSLVRRWRGGGAQPDDLARGVAALLAVCAISVVVWAAIMFGPATTFVHHGSHVPILVVLAAPMAWLFDRHRPVAILLGAAGAALFLKTYVPCIEESASYIWDPATVSRRAVLLAVLGLAGVVVAFVGLRENRPATSGVADRDDRPAGPPPHTPGDPEHRSGRPLLRSPHTAGAEQVPVTMPGSSAPRVPVPVAKN